MDFTIVAVTACVSGVAHTYMAVRAAGKSRLPGEMEYQN